MTLDQQLDALGMTRRGLARFLGCSATAVRGWCDDAATTPPAVAAWLAQTIATKPTIMLRAGRPVGSKGKANG